MEKKKEDQPLRALKKAKLALTINPRINCAENSKTKVPTIQAMIIEFAVQAETIEKPMGIRPLLTRFILFLDRKGFIITHRNDQ